MRTVTEPSAARRAEELLESISKLASQHDVMVLSDYAKGLLTDDVIRSCIEIAKRHHCPSWSIPNPSICTAMPEPPSSTPNSKEVMDATGIDPTDDDALAEAAGSTILRTAP